MVDSDTTFSKIHRLNNGLACFFGSILCIPLIYVIIRKTPTSLKVYTGLLLLSAFANTYFILVDLWCGSRIRINQGTLLASFTGIGSYFQSYWVQSYVSVPLQVSGVMLNFTVVSAQFYYRFCLTKQLELKIKRKTFLLFGISLFFALSSGFFAAFSVYFSAKCQSNFDFGSLWLEESSVPLLMCGLMPYYLLYTACLIIGSYSVAILFGVLTARRLKLDNFRENARIQKLHSQFNRIVIIQSTIPFLLATISILVGVVSVNIDKIWTFIMMGIAWTPFFSSLITILLIAPYRKRLFKWCFRPAQPQT